MESQLAATVGKVEVSGVNGARFGWLAIEEMELHTELGSEPVARN